MLRPYYLPPDPASRTTYEPGHRLQCDLWFPPVDVPLGDGQVGSPPVLVMVAGYSRMMFALMLPSRQAPNPIAGHWALLTSMGAVARELVRIGYSEAAAGGGEQVALVRVLRTTWRPGRDRSPVSVGGGASVGSYGSGMGLGIGIDLSGRPKEQTTTELGVMIRDRASGRTLWEGRANFTVPSDAPLAQTQLGAAKMAEAMFKQFPGNSGETVEVQ